MTISINDLRRSFFGSDEHETLQQFYDAGISAVDLLGIFDLPTVDPGVANQLWNDAGTVKVSAGA